MSKRFRDTLTCHRKCRSTRANRALRKKGTRDETGPDSASKSASGRSGILHTTLLVALAVNSLNSLEMPGLIEVIANDRLGTKGAMFI